MIISTSLTIGQMTFVARLAIQILSYGSLVFIPIILVGNAPRLAPIVTHDVINRVIGACSATMSIGKWIIDRVRRKSNDPTLPVNLLLIFLLSISYSIFVALSDIGFLGFYSCSVSGPDSVDLPASIASDDAARLFVLGNMVNGTNLTDVTAWRCDASELVNVAKDSFNNCTAWHMSTYADLNLFSGINSTDSDTLLPRQLKRRFNSTDSGILFPNQQKHGPSQQNSTVDVNSFYVGPSTHRLREPILQNGIAIEPHTTGVRAVFGVPQLALNKKVTISKTMAMELDVGCISLGIYAQGNVDDRDAIEWMVDGDSWSMYTGPDYMRDVLLKTANDVRAYIRPSFPPNLTHEAVTAPLFSAAKVTPHRLPYTDNEFTMLHNCTDALQKQLGIPFNEQRGEICGYLGVGGSIAVGGERAKGYHRMVCAAVTQVNMVSATVGVDGLNKTSLNITRLPSDLHYLQADYQPPSGESNQYFIPYERYTLSDNPTGPTTHFARSRKYLLGDSQIGPGGGGNAIGAIGNIVIDGERQFNYFESAALELLDNGFEPMRDLPTAAVTEWVGGVGGSLVLASLTYNGYAARHMAPMLVKSTGGKTASCFEPRYVLGFLPLVCAATVLLVWTVLVLVRTSLLDWTSVRDAYSGLAPYTAVASPDAPPNETLLVWERSAPPTLEVVSKGYVVTGSPGETALQYFESNQPSQG